MENLVDIKQKDDSTIDQNRRKFAYYPGCSLESTAIDFNVSVKNLFKALDIHFEEIKDWNCCGTTPAYNVSKEMSIALSARNLFLAKNMGLEEIICPCVSCYCKLSKASILINNKEIKSESEIKTQKEIFEVFHDMGFKTEGEFNFKVYSLVELLYKNKELIRQKFFENKNKNSINSEASTIESEILKDLKPVCYYGCVLLRTKGVSKFDNMENPTSMEEILDTVGIKSKHFRFKTECCGAILSLTHKNIVLKLSKEILDAALEAGANSIVVCCPLCQQNLDLRQSQINKHFKSKYNIPVYYISQILGLAMGLSYKDVMIDRLFVEPKFIKK